VPETSARASGKSLFAEVFGFRPLYCRIHQYNNFTLCPRGDGIIAHLVLNFVLTRGPYPGLQIVSTRRIATTASALK
jgi:hypothetical protein